MDVASILAASTNAAAAGSSTQNPKAATDAAQLANEDTFLKLLVAQMKNQDPLKPQDGTEFLSQLAQFSQLEQLIAIREQLAALKPQATDPSSQGTNSTPGNNAAVGTAGKLP